MVGGMGKKKKCKEMKMKDYYDEKIVGLDLLT